MNTKHVFLTILSAVLILYHSVAEAQLSAPSNLTASTVSSSQINLTWRDTNKTETGFSIERSPSSTSGFAVVGTTGKNITTYVDNGLASGTIYYYRVRAIRSVKNEYSQYSNVASATTQAADTTAPSVPTGLTASAISCSQINLSRNASTDTGGSGLKGYNVYRGGAYLKQVLTTSTSDTGLAASTSYSYTVSAIDNAGNESAQCSAANAATPACPDTTAPSVPTGLTATASSCSQINLSWNA